ncbi:hypothetical protein Micbo1qcDRAFT_212616 [Microdochium bolleyi]|uniref:Uncharacterized protein n=1 Tax=Microdochium bolleyi TaxID=196109 RepID=A0A136IX24_9PEZI|nr:hypothetical protein Micbo1qcDRAFT_212616 [Microdochium bolleyi]
MASPFLSSSSSSPSSSSTETGRAPDTPGWILPIYPDTGWAANVDFLIMIITRADSTIALTDGNKSLEGCLECFAAEQTEDFETVTSTSPAIASDKTRFTRRWTTLGQPCTERIRRAAGLVNEVVPAEAGSRADLLLYVFRAVVPAGSWAFYLSKTACGEACQEDNRVFAVQVSDAMDAVTCSQVYERSTYATLRDVILKNREERRMFADQLKDFQYHGKPAGPARGDPASQVQVWPRVSG